MLEREAHGLVGAGVAGEPGAAARAPLRRGADLRIGVGSHFRPERLAHEIVAGDVDLDGVDALADREAHGAAHLVGAVGDQADALVVHVHLALVAEPAGGDDLGRGGAHARAGNLAGVDRVADHDLRAQLGAGGASRCW